MHEPFSRHLSWGVIGMLWLASLLLAVGDVVQGGFAALFDAHNVQPTTIILHSMWLPRQGMAIVGGATLGLCGWLMQRALRNPLAEPGSPRDDFRAQPWRWAWRRWVQWR